MFRKTGISNMHGFVSQKGCARRIVVSRSRLGRIMIVMMFEFSGFKVLMEIEALCRLGRSRKAHVGVSWFEAILRDNKRAAGLLRRRKRSKRTERRFEVDGFLVAFKERDTSLTRLYGLVSMVTW